MDKESSPNPKKLEKVIEGLNDVDEKRRALELENGIVCFFSQVKLGRKGKLLIRIPEHKAALINIRHDTVVNVLLSKGM